MPSESVWPMLFFLAGLFGFVMLILVCGVQSREQERAEALDAAESTAAAPQRSFFATLGAPAEPAPAAEGSVVEDVGLYLRGQTAAAQSFVARPSVDGLHVVDLTAIAGLEPTATSRIQSFLDRELRLVEEFVADPSLDRFHGQLAMVG